MSSVSISSLILFIAAMTVAAGVAGTMMTSISDISTSIDERSVDAARQIESETEIISDPGSDAIYNDSTTTITVLVKNVGSRTLSPRVEDIDVLVDGQYVPSGKLSTEVIGGGDWREEEVLRVTIDRALTSGEHRVVAIVNGDREVLEFYV